MPPETETTQVDTNQPTTTNSVSTSDNAWLMPSFFPSVLSFLFFSRILFIFGRKCSLETNETSFLVVKDNQTLINSAISQIKVKYIPFGGILRIVINDKKYSFVFSSVMRNLSGFDNLTGNYIKLAKDWEQQLLNLGASRA